MPTTSPLDKVLVTGANGYIAVWVLQILLERGYSVRGTVRSLAKGTHLTKLFEDKFPGKLEIVEVKDITVEGAFDEAVKGVHGVLHLASPVGSPAPEFDPQVMIKPAVDGTKGIFASILKFGSQVKRVVVTSSIVALLSADPNPHTLDEKSWNAFAVPAVEQAGAKAPDSFKYFASKVLAEKSAWDFYNEHKGSVAWDLSVIIPPLIFGPALHETPNNDSMRMFYERTIAPGSYNNQAVLGLAANGAAYVDVRDVAFAHILALEKAEAGGERLVVTHGAFVWQDWLDVIHAIEPFPLDAERKRVIPVGTKGAGKKHAYHMRLDGSSGEKKLGIKYRSMTETAQDSIDDFVRRGW